MIQNFYNQTFNISTPYIMETNSKKHNPGLTSLYRQILSYIVVMLLLVFINDITLNGYWWVIWPAAGWGIAILHQAIHLLFPSENN